MFSHYCTVLQCLLNFCSNCVVLCSTLVLEERCFVWLCTVPTVYSWNDDNATWLNLIVYMSSKDNKFCMLVFLSLLNESSVHYLLQSVASIFFHELPTESTPSQQLTKWRAWLLYIIHCSPDHTNVFSSFSWHYTAHCIWQNTPDQSIQTVWKACFIVTPTLLFIDCNHVSVELSVSILCYLLSFVCFHNLFELVKSGGMQWNFVVWLLPFRPS